MPISNSEDEASAAVSDPGAGPEYWTHQKPQASEQMSGKGPRIERPLSSPGAQDESPTAGVLSSNSNNNQEVHGQVMNVALQKDELQGLGDGTKSQDNETLPIDSKSDLILVPEEKGDGDKKSDELEDTKDMTPGQRAEDALKRVAEYTQLVETRLANLETKMGVIGAETKKTNEVDSSHKRFPAIPELRRVTWAGFKNRIKDNHKTYAVEALIGEAKYYYQRSKQQTSMAISLNEGADKAYERSKMASGRGLGDHKEIVDRIRINSVPILMILGDISDQELSVEPTVHIQPFKFLVHHSKGIRSRLVVLESRWSDREAEESLSRQNERSSVGHKDKSDLKSSADPDLIPLEAKISPKEADIAGKGVSDKGEIEQLEGRKRTKYEDLVDSVEALKDLRCLVQFMDQELRDADRYAKDDPPNRILFRDLWHLFKPGDHVYVPLQSTATEDKASSNPSKNESNDKRYHVSWRVHSTWGGRPNLTAGDDDETLVPKQKTNPFELRCYYIDFSKSYFPSTHIWKIKPFLGEREVTSLEVYPWRYRKDSVKIKSLLKDRGEKFRDFTTFKYRFYKGSTLVCQPCGCPFVENSFPSYPEQIESEVIIDFTEAFRQNSSRSPYVGGRGTVFNERETEDALAISVWKDDKQDELDEHRFDEIYDDSLIDTELTIDFESKDPIWKADQESGFTNGEGLREEDLILLPARVLAYVFRKQHFAALDIDNLQPIVKPYKKGWKDLKLPKGHKAMLKALVKNHLSERESKALHAGKEHDYDLVRGKGQGLIVLLHGVPGVGKTSTAECVAESHSKPLLQITCGDLGLTAESVEKELDDKFHLAATWDCVLLLDEADVFLAQRTKHDLQRNALVSVFLRVLEYYTGILFLTTNRVGAFDDAFRSRIHLPLYYPPLDEEQTLSIWEMNLKRTLDRKVLMSADKDQIMSYAKFHFQSGKRSNSTWNGRQIRNAFQTATALAEADARERQLKEVKKGKKDKSAPIQPVLLPKWFDVVAQASFDFDKYLEGIGDETLAERANRVSERNDAFQSTNIMTGRPHSGAPRSNEEMVLEMGQSERLGNDSRTDRRERSRTDHRRRPAQTPEPPMVYSHMSDPRRSQQMNYPMASNYGTRSLEPGMGSYAGHDTLPQARYREPFQRQAQLSPERLAFQNTFRRESYSNSDSDSNSEED